MPTFAWEVDSEVKLIIDYNDNQLPDVVRLSRIHSTFGLEILEELENECLFSGHLDDINGINIRVNGCPLSHTFQVNSRYLKFQFSIYYF